MQVSHKLTVGDLPEVSNFIQGYRLNALIISKYTFNSFGREVASLEGVPA